MVNENRNTSLLYDCVPAFVLSLPPCASVRITQTAKEIHYISNWLRSTSFSDKEEKSPLDRLLQLLLTGKHNSYIYIGKFRDVSKS